MTRGRFLAILFFCLLAPLPARAGIYLTDEPPLLPVPTTLGKDRLDAIWAHVGDLRSAPDFKRPPDPPTFRTYYQENFKRLRQRETDGLLTLADRNDLGACLLRVQDPESARAVLFQAERQSEGSGIRFLILANLATANHALFERAAAGRTPNLVEASNFLDQAIKAQQDALALWPDLYPGWWRWQSRSFRRAEQFYLRLLEVRQEEFRHRLRDPSPAGGAFTHLDNLFPGVRFVGSSGKYEAGDIARESWDRLPTDAIPIVVQLVFWLPGDDRLYWLLGELFNSYAQVTEAYQVLDDLVYNRNLRSVQELNSHRLILRDAEDVIEAWQASEKEHYTTLQIAAAFAPRFFTGVPGIGPAATDSVWAALALNEEQRRKSQQFHLPTGPEVNLPPPDPPRGQREWGAIFVGFLLGIVVGILGVWQVRQWRQHNADRLAQRRLTAG